MIGAGAIGLLTGLICVYKGVRHLQLAETNPLRRSTAEAAGLSTFDPREETPQTDSFEAVFIVSVQELPGIWPYVSNAQAGLSCT